MMEAQCRVVTYNVLVTIHLSYLRWLEGKLKKPKMSCCIITKYDEPILPSMCVVWNILVLQFWDVLNVISSKEQKWNIFVILGNRLRPTGTLLNLNQIEHILDWKSINLSEPSAKINWRAFRWMCAWKSPIRSHMDWGLRGKLLHHSWPSKRWLQTGQTFIRNEPKYITPAYFCHRVSFWLTHGIVTSNSW